MQLQGQMSKRFFSSLLGFIQAKTNDTAYLLVIAKIKFAYSTMTIHYFSLAIDIFCRKHKVYFVFCNKNRLI